MENDYGCCSGKVSSVQKHYTWIYKSSNGRGLMFHELKRQDFLFIGISVGQNSRIASTIWVTTPDHTESPQDYYFYDPNTSMILTPIYTPENFP